MLENGTVFYKFDTDTDVRSFAALCGVCRSQDFLQRLIIKRGSQPGLFSLSGTQAGRPAGIQVHGTGLPV
jgi:hypothetical protein